MMRWYGSIISFRVLDQILTFWSFEQDSHSNIALLLFRHWGSLRGRHAQVYPHRYGLFLRRD